MNQFARTTRKPAATATVATSIPSPGNNGMIAKTSDAASAVSAITGATFSQQDKDKKGPKIKCYECGQKGHIGKDCPTRTQQQHHQDMISAAGDDTKSVGSILASSTTGAGRSKKGNQPQVIGWTEPDEAEPVQLHQMSYVSRLQIPQTKLRRTIYLDTGANMDTILGNPDLVFNVRPSKTRTSMRTNNGTKTLSTEADMGGRSGPVWFDLNFNTIIFGFSKMVDEGYHVRYDSRVIGALCLQWIGVYSLIYSLINRYTEKI
jgi:hypothetical protein